MKTYRSKEMVPVRHLDHRDSAIARWRRRRELELARKVPLQRQRQEQERLPMSSEQVAGSDEEVVEVRRRQEAAVEHRAERIARQESLRLLRPARLSSLWCASFRSMSRTV